jgi:alkyldihydroxyacetonephosphate synthase
MVLCHLSHAFRDGGSLYFTLLAPRLPGRDLEQWMQLKGAATEAILESGGTLSHHHGIGSDHLRWMRAEHGEVAVGALRVLKAELDPRGVMNPGKLLEEGD